MIAVLYVALVLIVLVAAAGMIPLKRYADRAWARHQRIEIYRLALLSGARSVNEIREAFGLAAISAREAAVRMRALGEAMKARGSVTGRIKR